MHYFIDQDAKYEPVRPSFDTDVIRLYGLHPIAQSLARVNPDGSKGVKLRKSYKNHVADLPGKHAIPTERTLSPIVFRPDNPDLGDVQLKQYPLEQLKALFSFEKSSINGVPGFDSSKLAIDSLDSSAKKERKRKGTPTTPSEPDQKKRHVQLRELDPAVFFLVKTVTFLTVSKCVSAPPPKRQQPCRDECTERPHSADHVELLQVATIVAKKQPTLTMSQVSARRRYDQVAAKEESRQVISSVSKRRFSRCLARVVPLQPHVADGSSGSRNSDPGCAQ
ncbi:hypothetical protein KL948_000661 [Ogataea haglerorum]|nr:hypothetical protein KL948_000661 [Ogataea haglerorum]